MHLDMASVVSPPEEGEAIDSFYIIDRDITKIVNETRQRKIADRLREAIEELYAA